MASNIRQYFIDLFYHFCAFLCFVFLKLCFGLKIYGRENIPKTGPVILACNHRSYLDPLILGVGAGKKVYFLARDTLFENKIFALILRALEVQPLERNSADIKALKSALRILSQKKTLGLFPEATRQAEGTFGKALGGVGFIASKSNAKVIPAYIEGSGSAWAKGAKMDFNRKVSIHFGKQIHIERGMPYEQIASLLMEHIRHLSCIK
ncbi:MAG: 1-acyl-sn-glycerol-3-phosphate acyltransferase [Candidatus Omnitrophica bacterium]|nr:1-acyl-sn-glycerol-3-phosphate acyltransferase [Candidatus Omnitrophota bacterium]